MKAITLLLKLAVIAVFAMLLLLFVAFVSMQSTHPEVGLRAEDTIPEGLPPADTPVAIPDQTVPKKSPIVASSSVSTPGALIAPQKTPPAPTGSAPTTVAPPLVGALNQQDIILLTNSERTQRGLPALTFNATLSLIAEVKARDMIARQYFAHVSPIGTTISDLALQYNYAYRNIGENLALGDFEDSKDVVTGWMNSPGHRANILHTDFTEIGVAAILGNYNGRRVWYSVQEFGRPMPNCPTPSTALEQKITLYQSQITTTEKTLINLKEEIETSNFDEQTYRAKANDYNTIVKLYNDLVEVVKQDIVVYNSQVSAYNTCLNL